PVVVWDEMPASRERHREYDPAPGSQHTERFGEECPRVEHMLEDFRAHYEVGPASFNRPFPFREVPRVRKPVAKMGATLDRVYSEVLGIGRKELAIRLCPAANIEHSSVRAGKLRRQICPD